MQFVPSAHIVVAVLLSVLALSGADRRSAFGQAGESGGALAARDFDPIDFRGRTEFEVSDPATVPRQVARAAEQSECRYVEGLTQVPIRFLKVQGRRLALVYCYGIVGTHRVFDLANVRRPQPVAFPFLAQDTGFGATLAPGYLVWRKDTGAFEAETGTDLCPSSRLRHVYRLGSTEGWVTGALTFVLVRVDVSEKSCGERDPAWSTVWEAPNWPKTTIVR